MCPSKNIFAKEQEHTNFLVATEEYAALEFFLAIGGVIETAVLFQPLKGESRSGAFEKFISTPAPAERVENEWRKLEDLDHVVLRLSVRRD